MTKTPTTGTFALGRLSIRARLCFGTVFALILLVVIGGLGYTALDRTRTTLDNLFAQQVQTLSDVAELRTTLGDIRRTEKDIIVNFVNSVEVGLLRESWTKSIGTLTNGLGQLQRAKTADSEFVEAIGKALVEVEEYRKGLNPVFEQIERAQIDGSVGGAYAERFKQHIETTDKLMLGLSVVSREQMEVARGQLNSMTVSMAGLIAGVLALALAVLIPLTLFSVRSIMRSLALASALAEQIAAGDLSHDVTVTSKDEVGQLIAAMGLMQDSLRGLVFQVQEAANNISTASEEIASGNYDLGHRTEQTAANLQETAASISNLAQIVADTANSTRQANQLAMSATQVATKGGEVVSQVVATMDEIAAGSKKIADIVSIIDGIAFQTNILALNAAVEAARAGDRGRGFAVVATEVRALASRSAEAAKEIKSLIQDSVDKVNDGAELVATAGSTMSDIMNSVQRVTALMSEINHASAEQSSQIGQVSRSASELDKMTQQNAALVEESTAASESLREQAVQLAEAANQFKLSESSSY